MDVVYIFDSAKKVRKVLPGGVSELIHKEAEYELEAQISQGAEVKPGEFLGFACVDGRFRIFEVDDTEEDDLLAVTRIDGTDAAVAELAEKVIEHVEIKDAAPADAVAALLAGTDWTIKATAAGKRKTTQTVYYQTAWEALRDTASACAVRIVPYYTFGGGEITGRCIDLQEMAPVFRGRIYDGARDASDIVLTRTGSPCTVAYGVGKSTGEGNDPARVTIAGAVWSKEAGDPADKPSGQTWVADAEALAKYGRKEMVFDDQQITDATELLEKTWEALEAQREPVVGGEITISDVESVPGQSFRQIRLYDLIAVVTRQGETFTAQAIGIDRDYVRPEESKIKLGAETDDWKAKSLTSQIAKIKNEVAKARGGAGRAGNSAEKNKELIVENMDTIRLHTISINEQANRIGEAEIELGKAKARISANEKSLTDQGDRISSTEIVLNGTESTIGLIAQVEANGQAISAASIEINGVKSQITLKANKTVVDGILSAGLTGVTLLSATKVAANNGNFDKLSINGDPVVLNSQTMVTGVTFPQYEENTIYYTDHSGNNKSMLVLTPKKKVTGSRTTATIAYLST